MPEKPLVSLLIPARNEEHNIGNILDDLMQLSYREVEIIVYDDFSDDRTAEIVREKMLRDNRIKLTGAIPLPPGWLGKNHACFHLAGLAKGDYFLFLDADVRIRGNLIERCITHTQCHSLSLLSIFPQQIMKTAGEKSTVPLMHYILLTLLPLILVRTSRYPSLSAANGQFMLFGAETYGKIQPHFTAQSENTEDIMIAKLYKKKHLKVACLTGENDVSCRMYNSFIEAVNGFSKNMVMFFGNSFPAALLFWLATTFGIVAAIFFATPLIFIILLAIVLLTRTLFSLAAGQNILMNILFMVPQQLSMGLILMKWLTGRLTKKQIWKGRNIRI